ncbi:MAG: kynureninase [Gammaproteobacteria bacterium]
MTIANTREYAAACDASDPLRDYRARFVHPKLGPEGRDALYFTGNSLGLMPKTARGALEVELDDWGRLGVEGHFEGTNPWLSYHERLTPASARLVGAREGEVVCMNSLTTNLHLLFVSFYRPTVQRFKIISEAKMFPSDRYLLETQVRYHGFDPDEAIIEVGPRAGTRVIEEEDIIAAIEAHRDELALVFFGGVQYFTGQFFDIQAIAAAAHNADVPIGVDLAHAVGNVPLSLHDWNVDFAAWCTYKYLNGSPGNVGGAFVHERHATAELPRFGGWWGHDKESRFLMEPGFNPIPGAEGWQLSNAPVMGMAVLAASLAIFDEVGMSALREKSLKLTAFLEFVFRAVVEQAGSVSLELITPSEAERRGCQLSVRLVGGGKTLFDALTAHGVISDFREPDVVRLAPVPLYNSFEDVWRFGQVLATVLREQSAH